MVPTLELDAEVRRLWQESEPEGGMVSGYFLIMEGVDAEGDQCLDFCWTDGLKLWTLRGWLHEALATQLVGQVASELEEN